MPDSNRRSTRRPPLALGTALLTLTFLSACSPDPEVATSETTSTSTTSTTVDEADPSSTTSSTTEPAEPEPVDPDAGTPTVLPDSMWGVEAGSYDLVRLATDSGDIIERIPGWGAEAGSGEQEGGAQALQEIAAAGGSVWVADCCEPAVGTVFRVDPASTGPVPESAVRVNGTYPVLSADGSRLAVSVLDFGIAIHDATTGDLLVSPELIGSVVSPPEGIDAPFFATPVAWVDGDTVAVAVNGDATSTITLVSIAQPSTPTAVGPVISVDGPIIDGATRSDGALVLALEIPGSGDVAGRAYSVETGDEDAAFVLDPATIAIDYDATGTFLLVSRENLPPIWQGRGETGEIGGAALVFVAWDE